MLAGYIVLMSVSVARRFVIYLITLFSGPGRLCSIRMTGLLQREDANYFVLDERWPSMPNFRVLAVGKLERWLPIVV